MNLIGIAGRAGAGKDTVADILVKQAGYVKVALADPMKRACAEWFEWSAETLWGPSEKRNEPHDRLGGLTARKALQTLGTEWGRACYENVWVDYAIRTATFLLNGEEKTSLPPMRPSYDAERGAAWRQTRFNEARTAYLPDQPRGVVISDCRFPNEVAAIRAAGGRIWRVVRPVEGATETWRLHESEAHVDQLDVDTTIINAGSLVQLADAIHTLMAFPEAKTIEIKP